MNFPFSKSLSLRLLAIFLATAALLIFILASQFKLGLGAQWRTHIQPHLVRYAENLQNELGYPPDADIAQSLADSLPIEIHIYEQDQLQYSTNGSEIVLSDLEFRKLPKLLKKHNRRRDGQRPLHPTGKQFRKPDSSKEVRLVVDNSAGTRYLLSEMDGYKVLYEFDRDKQQNIRNNHSLIAILSFLGVLALSYLVIRRQLSPINGIQSGIQRMSAGELDHRIPIQGNDDLSKLGNSINDMAEQIEDMLNAKRQLLLSISHELRSPLARARVASEMLPESTNRERLIDDLRDMDSMIQDIMESEQLSQNHAALNIQKFNLATAIDKVVAQHPTDNINLNTPAELTIEADRTRIELLIRNLLNNAIEHGASENSRIDINAAEKSKGDINGVEITIRDYGQGIDPVHLSRITEPFYRPDASRTRTTGGFGMGLNLAKLIAQAHRGDLHLSSNPAIEPGTTATVWLPVQSAST